MARIKCDCGGETFTTSACLTYEVNEQGKLVEMEIEPIDTTISCSDCRANYDMSEFETENS